MKRVYITPEIKTLQLRTLNFFAASPDPTHNIGEEGGSGTGIGNEEPDPTQDPDGSRWLRQSMWDEE